MITQEQFKHLIEVALCFDAELDRWNDFGLSLFELPVAELSWEIFDCALRNHFKQPEIDTIYWWLFERDRDCTEPDAWDEDGNVIPTKTIDDLWNMVKDFQ